MQTDKGMEQTFVQAFREHREAMFRLARSMLLNDWDAEDAVSDAVERAWNAVGSLRDWDRVRPWLLRITYRCCLEVHRIKKRLVPMDPQMLTHLAYCDPEETPLWVYLDMLPMKSRVVMQLRYGEGLPIDEISAVLRLPRGTISSRISRASRHLKEILLKEQHHG